MYCPNCKAKLRKSDDFCSKCGARVPAGKASIQVEQDVGTVEGQVVGAILGRDAMPAGLTSSTTQKVDAVKNGGALVGTIVGDHAQVDSQRRYGDVVHGDKVGGDKIAVGIHAGRDMVMGDQYNALCQQVAQINTPAEFIALLQQVQAELAALKQQPEVSPTQVDDVKVAEENVQQALEEAQKPKPLAARITATLTGAKVVLDSLIKSVEAAVGLGAVLAGLIQLAARLFGG